MSENCPRQVETYKGVPIWFNPLTGKFYANHCEHVKRDKDVQKVKKWLDDWKS